MVMDMQQNHNIKNSLPIVKLKKAFKKLKKVKKHIDKQSNSSIIEEVKLINGKKKRPFLA